jgi:DNA polymerase III sliding clamp (beta) subunit (PCNA family)
LTLRLTPKDVLVLESVGGGSTAKIPGIRSGDNPPEFGLPLGYVLPKFAETPASSLRGALSCVAFASSAEGHRRFSLQGVLFHVVDGKLRLVATDGKCLALSRVEPCEALPVRVLVPSSTVGFLDKVLKGHDGPVQLGADETSFSVALPGVTMRSSITTENFPPYEAHVSRNLIQDVRCDTRELVAALKRLDSVIGDEDDCALLELRPGWVCVSWKGRAGEGIEFIHAEHDVSRLVGISARRLASGLSVFSGSEMRMGFVDDAGPLFIEDAERRRLCVVMPKALDLVVAESDRVPPQSVASVPGE